MATSPSARSGAPAAAAAEKMPLTIMFAATLAAFIAAFNETFLNVGFTSIMADFEIGVSTVQWLATVYNISENVKATLDVPSVTLVAIALLGLLYGISTIFGPAKLVAVIALLVGIVALVLFVKRQKIPSTIRW